MKKLTISLLVALSFLLVACDNKIIEIPIEVPDGEVELPNETEDPVTEDPTETEDPVGPNEPEVEIITEIVEKYIEVPAEVEMMRKYAPGTYFASTNDVNPSGGYSFVVVVIDAYGDIAGVHIDETFSSIVLYEGPAGDLYTYIEGDGVSVPNTYRKVHKDMAYKNYPNSDDAITTDDLIEGIHNAVINRLTEVQVNETKNYLNGDLNLGGTVDFKSQIDLIVNKVMADNTTYGFNLYRSGSMIKTDSIAGVTISVDSYLDLIQGILDGDAALQETTILKSKDNPTFGVYTPGTYVEYSDRELDNGNLNFGFSVTVVDECGAIAGVYLDETFNNKIIDGTFSTKGIMQNSYGLSNESEYEWFEQMERLSEQIIYNQGIDGIHTFQRDVFGTETAVEVFTEGLTQIYTDSIAGVSVRVDRVAQAVKKSLEEALYTDYEDGIYFAQDNDGLFGLITISDSEISSIYFDRLKTVFQAQYEYQGEEYGLYRFIRTFDLGDVTVPKALMVYEKDGAYYSSIDLQEIEGVELSSGQDLDKDERVDMTGVELASLVVVPGNYTASIAGNSDYVNLSGWKENNDLLIQEFIKNNGTHTIYLDNGDYIVHEDILYYDVSNVVRLINSALYEARTGNPTFKEVGTSTSQLLADGEFFVHSGPDAKGEIAFAHMTIIDGNIRTLYFDRTVLTEDGTTTLFNSTEGEGSWREQMILFTENVMNNQGYVVNQILDDYVYYDEESLNNVGGDPVFELETTLFEEAEYIGLLEQLVDQSVNARLLDDALAIEQHLMDTKLGDFYFMTHQLLPDFLPRTFVSNDLANEYELEWLSSNERDLDIEQPENGYDVVVDDDITEDQTIDITMLVRLPGADRIIYEKTYTFDILTRQSDAEILLNDKSFRLPAAYLIEGSIFTFPTDVDGKIKWKSNNESVLSSDGTTFDINTDTEVMMTAYVDIDNNGLLSNGEPTKEFYVTVLTTENAIEKVRDSIAISNIYQYIDGDFELSKRSPVWGVTYTWEVFNPYVEMIDHPEYTEVKIRRVGFDANVVFTANLSIGSANNDVSKQIKILEGNKGVYEEYSNEDLDAITFNAELQNLIVGDDLMFDDLVTGLVRGSDVTFEVNDFEMFIDTDGVVIANHPTKDAEFVLTVSSKYNSGTDTDTITREYPVRIISSETMYDYVLADKEELSDYAVDLSHNMHLDVVLNLPTEGHIHDSDIVWSLPTGVTLDANKFDVSQLDQGIITILTKTGADELEAADSFTLVAEVSIGDILTTKNIEINLRD